MGFIRKDMNYVHYKWGGYGSKRTGFDNGEPARRYFDPFNGEQVLFMINYCASVIGNLSLGGAREIETRIAYALPGEVISERFVFNWLMKRIVDEKIC